MSNFNVNYQFNTQFNNVPTDDTLLAITPYCHVEILSKQHLLLSHTENKQSLVLAIYLSNVIDILKTFRSLSEHIKEIKRFMGLNHSATADIKNVIQQLQENGFIITAEEVLQQSLTGGNYQPLQTPPVVVVRTARRVSMLKRFLQSAVDNEFRYNARYEYLIIDDSTPELAEANAINIKNSGLNAKHIDHTVQQTLLDQWLTQFPQDRDAIQFLLGSHPLHELSPTYGRTWNWGILLSAGKPVVYLDDDCLLQTYAPPIKTTSKIGLGRVGQEVVFLDKNKSLEEQLQPTALDPIAQLTQVLGLTLLQLPCDTNSFIEADHDTSEKLGKAHVMIANPAVAGDPGSSNPIWLYFTRAESAERFWSNNESDYQRHKTERYLWVGDKQPQLAFGGNYSVVARAFDNRQLLPPTLPIFRNEDALFTNLIHYLYPYGATLSTTWALAHQPEIERKWTDEETHRAKSFDITMAMDDFIDTSASIPHSTAYPKDKLLSLATAMQQAFSADENAIQQWLFRHQQSARASQVRALQNALEEVSNSAPEYWQEDVKNMMNANIQNDNTLYFDNFSPDSAVEALQAFAHALPVWDKLWLQASQRELV